MANKNHPSVFRCYEAALPDEHMFVLLARDPAGPATIRFWIEERRRMHKTETVDDVERLEAARMEAKLFARWREANLDPTGDGVPSWRLPRNLAIEDGKPGLVEYVPAESDGAEGVRVSKEWLTSLADRLDSGEMPGYEVATLLRLAVGAPKPTSLEEENRRPFNESDTARMARELHEAGEQNDRDPTLWRLREAIDRLKDGRLPTPHDLYRALASDPEALETDPWRYETIGLGLTDLENIERALTKGLIDQANEQTVYREGLIAVPGHKDPQTIDQIAEAYRKVALAQKWPSGGTVTSINGKPVGTESLVNEIVRTVARPTVDSKPDDLAHAPEVPPHRFSQFFKGERYAYARGLEVNPTHLPVALDAMAKDGWHLIAIFGQTDTKNIGFVFEHREPPLMCVSGWYPEPDETGTETVSKALEDFKAGVPLADIDVTGYGRGLQP